MSDIHLEFHLDGGKQFIGLLDATGVDVLVLAGDVGTSKQHETALRFLCAKYPHVVLVLGNHDYYRATLLQVHQGLQKLCAELPNLHWLHNSTVEILGQRFIGTPLWFADHPLNEVYAKSLNDFHQIPQFRTWNYQENQRATEFLRDNLRPGDFVVTHHLPTHRSNKHYQNDPLSRFFVCDLEPLLYQGEAAVWVHGHTHESMRYTFGETLVLCNPFGYLEFKVNEDFDPRLLVNPKLT